MPRRALIKARPLPAGLVHLLLPLPLGEGGGEGRYRVGVKGFGTIYGFGA
jgi:hypothetical protein